MNVGATSARPIKAGILININKENRLLVVAIQLRRLVFYFGKNREGNAVNNGVNTSNREKQLTPMQWNNNPIVLDLINALSELCQFEC